MKKKYCGKIIDLKLKITVTEKVQGHRYEFEIIGA